MLKRLFLGLVLGALVGALVAAVLVRGLGIAVISAQSEGANNVVLMYLAASVAGVVTGLVAGKPIWSADGKIEAGLKAFFGALLGIGGMFALRTWAHVHVDLSMLNAGEGLIGELPAASLPILAAALASVYELDNSPGEKGEKTKQAGSPKAGAGKKVRVAEEREDGDDEIFDEPAARRKRR